MQERIGRNALRSLWAKRLLAAGLGWIFLTACLALAGVKPNLQKTAEAFALQTQIRDAQLTIISRQASSAPPTQEASLPHERTPPPKYSSPTPVPPHPPSHTPTSPKPTATLLPQVPTATISVKPCNQAVFVRDVSVSEGAQLPINSLFTKIWRVMNTGSCEWSTQYFLVYSGGDLSNPSTNIPLPAPVQPGATIDLSVTMQAPAYPGEFRGYWMLRDPSGVLFGFGLETQTPLALQIKTFQTGFTGNSTIDLTANYCSATWVSGAGLLTCPGSTFDQPGSVSLIRDPVFETQPRTGYGILTRPDNGPNGTITGQFSLSTIHSGDVFLAEIGCLQNSPGCSLNFRLDYQTADGQSGSLGTWRETFDGRTTPLEVDLSSLAGRAVWLNLRVQNLGVWQTANGYWYQPRIQSGSSISRSVLTWTRTGVPDRDACQELRVRLDGFGSASADAYDCRSGERYLGRRNLNADELGQLEGWLRRLSEAGVEVYSAGGSNPVVVWISFKGLGGAEATNADIREIDRFSAALFSSISR